MSAPSTPGLSVELLLRFIDVKYGCLTFTLLYLLSCSGLERKHGKTEESTKRRQKDTGIPTEVVKTS